MPLKPVIMLLRLTKFVVNARTVSLHTANIDFSEENDAGRTKGLIEPWQPVRILYNDESWFVRRTDAFKVSQPPYVPGS